MTRNVDLMLEYRRFFEMRNKSFRASASDTAKRCAHEAGMAIAAIQGSELPSVAGTSKGRSGRKAQTKFMERHVGWYRSQQSAEKALFEEVVTRKRRRSRWVSKQSLRAKNNQTKWQVILHRKSW